ncbi:class I SAM-dependent methyltransferase [Hoeflea sp.]|uniref:class I SAM-dependent methyltransferase n=1 Tax=Hoeflea sp. TaxID=1940281 RepID=UPI003BAF352B
MSETENNPFEIPAFRQRPETYLGPDRATAEKDVYRLLWDKLDAAGFRPGTILDVGCATGDLLVYLSIRLPDASLAGLDLEPALIDAAAKRPELEAAELHVGDALSRQLGKYEMVLCFGVMGIFDGFEPLLENLLANTAPGGRIYLQALLNPDDIDVRIAYRDNQNGRDWMRGFNIFSRVRVETWCRDRGLAARFYDFRMTSELDRRPHLPHRAYTVDMADGSRRTTNGMCLLLPETLLEIHVPA